MYTPFQAPISSVTNTTQPVPSYYGKQGFSTILEHSKCFICHVSFIHHIFLQCILFNIHTHSRWTHWKAKWGLASCPIRIMQTGTARDQTSNFQLADDLLNPLPPVKCSMRVETFLRSKWSQLPWIRCAKRLYCFLKRHTVRSTSPELENT